MQQPSAPNGGSGDYEQEVPERRHSNQDDEENGDEDDHEQQDHHESEDEETIREETALVDTLCPDFH